MKNLFLEVFEITAEVLCFVLVTAVAICSVILASVILWG